MTEGQAAHVRQLEDPDSARPWARAGSTTACSSSRGYLGGIAGYGSPAIARRSGQIDVLTGRGMFAGSRCRFGCASGSTRTRARPEVHIGDTGLRARGNERKGTLETASAGREKPGAVRGRVRTASDSAGPGPCACARVYGMSCLRTEPCGIPPPLGARTTGGLIWDEASWSRLS